MSSQIACSPLLALAWSGCFTPDAIGIIRTRITIFMLFTIFAVVHKKTISNLYINTRSCFWTPSTTIKWIALRATHISLLATITITIRSNETICSWTRFATKILTPFATIRNRTWSTIFVNSTRTGCSFVITRANCASSIHTATTSITQTPLTTWWLSTLITILIYWTRACMCNWTSS